MLKRSQFIRDRIIMVFSQMCASLLCDYALVLMQRKPRAKFLLLRVLQFKKVDKVLFSDDICFSANQQEFRSSLVSQVKRELVEMTVWNNYPS